MNAKSKVLDMVSHLPDDSTLVPAQKLLGNNNT